MYHQEQANRGSTVLIDTILVVVIIALFIFMPSIINLMANALGSTASLIITVAVLLALAACIYFFRISGYRYVYHFEEAGEYFDERYQKMVRTYPKMEPGTLEIKRGVANKGNVIETVMGAEMKALLSPDEPMPEGSTMVRGSWGSLKKAHTLLFERNGAKFALKFHPDDELIEYIERMIEKNNVA
ncbi:MAG: hypothetical protein IJA35_06730 [Clostridia bacterium]|nr:hypothetical protein [Clostridia bacterium]